MDSSLLVAVTVSLFVIFLLQRLFSRGNLPPGPTGLPFLGYIPFLSRMPYLDFQRLAKKYGNVFSVRMGSEYVVVLNDFESTKKAFALDAFMGRPPVSPFELNKETIDTGAFNDLPWKEQRRFSLHMLRVWALENQKWKDIYRQMLTRCLKESASAAGQAAWQLFFPTVRKIFKFLGIGDVHKVSNTLRDMKRYVMKEIEEHEKTLNPNDVRDYIDGYLLEIEKRKGDPSFCKPVLQDMVNALFGAGSETVRLSVEWLTLTAARFPDEQRRVQREIDEVIGQDKLPTWPDQKYMPYTQAFIMELMRWRTIIPINVTRYTLTDAEIGGYLIPKNSQIIANLWAIHHDPEYWGSDAEELRPERFLTEDGQGVKKWERYIPFSIGKRACPGEPLANIEVFLYFTAILQKFNLRIPHGKTLDFNGELGIGLMPKPQELIFTKRS